MPFQPTFKNKLFTYNLGYSRPKWLTSAFKISFCYEASGHLIEILIHQRRTERSGAALFSFFLDSLSSWLLATLWGILRWHVVDGGGKESRYSEDKLKSTLNSGNIGVCCMFPSLFEYRKAVEIPNCSIMFHIILFFQVFEYGFFTPKSVLVSELSIMINQMI